MTQHMSHFFRIVTFLVVLAVAIPAQAVQLPDFVPLAKTAGQAVVNINTEKKVQQGAIPGIPSELFRNLPREFERFFEQFGRQGGQQGAPRMQRSMGTGFIISADGYIVTNNHVVAEADVVRVNLEGTSGKDQALDAVIVGTDPDTDLALLKVNTDKPLPFLSFGDSDKAEVGEWLLAIGNPFGLGHTVTQGILSAKGRDIQSGPFDNFLQTDASINPGNSGGPLINMDGKVVGINTAIIASGQGIGFAIPSNMAQNIVEQLKDSKKVSRGWIGVSIQEIDANTAKALGLPNTDGALIGSVMEGQPAAKAGVKAGDVVVAVNNAPIKDASELLRSIANEKPKSTVTVTVWRDGKKRDIKITLGERGEQTSTAADPSTPSETPSLGLSVRALTPQEASAANLNDGGIVITRIENGKAAAEAGLRTGDIILTANLKPVKTVKELSDIIRGEAKKRGAVMLQVQRSGQVFFATVPIAEDKK